LAGTTFRRLRRTFGRRLLGLKLLSDRGTYVIWRISDQSNLEPKAARDEVVESARNL
jgi:hypothetical protein